MCVYGPGRGQLICWGVDVGARRGQSCLPTPRAAEPYPTVLDKARGAGGTMGEGKGVASGPLVGKDGKAGSGPPPPHTDVGIPSLKQEPKATRWVSGSGSPPGRDTSEAAASSCFLVTTDTRLQKGLTCPLRAGQCGPEAGWVLWVSARSISRTCPCLKSGAHESPTPCPVSYQNRNGPLPCPGATGMGLGCPCTPSWSSRGSDFQADIRPTHSTLHSFNGCFRVPPRLTSSTTPSSGHVVVALGGGGHISCLLLLLFIFILILHKTSLLFIAAGQINLQFSSLNQQTFIMSHSF